MTKEVFFTRAELAAQEEAGRARLLRNGRLFNARVYRVDLAGREWTVKDFADRPFYVRAVARLLLRHEVKVLNRLEGIPGMSPAAFRVDGAAMASVFLPGESLQNVERARITTEFLRELETLVRRMHLAGVVHLDISSMTNIIMDPAGRPGIIDFQSAVITDHVPRGFARWLEALDLRGVMKKWAAFQPEAMGRARRTLLEKMNRLRKLWVFKGYFGLKRQRAPLPPPQSAPSQGS